MKNILMIFAFGILLASCSPKIIQSTVTTEKDSTHVDTIRHTKIVKTKGDSVGLSFNLSEINKGHADIKLPEEELTFAKEDSIVFKKEVRNGKLTESVTVSRKGVVDITCKSDSLQQVIDQMIINSKNFKTKIITTTKTVEIPKPLTRFQEFCKWFTVFVMGAVSAIALYKLRKLIPI